MKKYRWLLVLVILAASFALGFNLSKGSAYWDRFESELYVSLLITGREDALTEQGEVYINQLIDMNVHGYLMADKSDLSSEDQESIENSLVRLLSWKSKNGFEFWLPDPTASEGLEFSMPEGASKDGYSMEEEYEVYRDRLDEFLKLHQRRLEMLTVEKVKAPIDA